MKGQIIGYGNSSEVYEWTDHTVLKLFKTNVQDQHIEYEALIHEIVYVKGIDMPKLIEEINYLDRRGFVYEKLNGRSLLYHIMKKKWRIPYYSRTLAKGHLQMHQHKAKLLPDLRERLRENIHMVKTLTVEELEAVMRSIDILPEGDYICHMDYQPSKIYYEHGQYSIIDWANTCRSIPAADIAQTYLILKHGLSVTNGPRWLKYLETLWRTLLIKNYLAYYFKNSGITFEDIEVWLKPLAMARLSKNISTHEKESLYQTYMR